MIFCLDSWSDVCLFFCGLTKLAFADLVTFGPFQTMVFGVVCVFLPVVS